MEEHVIGMPSDGLEYRPPWYFRTRRQHRRGALHKRRALHILDGLYGSCRGPSNLRPLCCTRECVGVAFCCTTDCATDCVADHITDCVADHITDCVADHITNRAIDCATDRATDHGNDRPRHTNDTDSNHIRRRW